jgi:hypothetical protein
MRRRRTEFWLGLWTLLFIVATAVIAFLHPFRKSENPPGTIALQVGDQNGRMRIDWDASNELVRNAQGATLEVEDGGVVNRYPVERKTLRSGGFDYLRKTQDVFLTLTLFQDGKPGAVATVRSIAPVQVQSAAAPAPDSRRAQTRGRRRR